MRITQRAMTQTALLGLNSNLSQLAKLQNQLTSGTTLSRPSDSPTGQNTAMLARRDLASNDQQATNITDGQTVLDATDAGLQAMIKMAQDVRAKTTQALNEGAMGTDSLYAVSVQVSGTRDSMLGQANQVVQGRALFGGVSSGKVAYDSTGAYVGIGGSKGIDPIPVNRRVSDTETIRVDLTGAEAFGDPDQGPDLFAVVKNIADHSAANDQTGLTNDLAALDDAISRMSKGLADVGTRQARMENAGDVNAANKLSLTAKLSATADVDMPNTIMQMQQQQVSYQAALQTTAQMLQPTLLDFLR